MKKRNYRKYVVWAIIFLTVAFLVKIMFFPNKNLQLELETDVAVKQKLFHEVSATGTINPLELVLVGTQVSGIIREIYVDFNSKVKKGQVIAKMDMRNLTATLSESQASLSQANISLQQSKRQLARTKELFKDGYVPKLDLENMQNTYDQNLASYKKAKLRVNRDKVNLGFATIVSPIDGVIISKKIERGQTVAAAFATPTLFTIANDLSKMKIEASVDEADIGQVKLGQKVNFTVDTYPEEEFTGIVEQIQLDPIVTSNVVTYKVIILLKNPENKLFPGMTATILIKTGESQNRITVPNSSVNYLLEPKDEKVFNQYDYSLQREKDLKKYVWLVRDKSIEQVKIDIDFSDGIRTSIKGDIKETDMLLTGYEVADANKKGSMFGNGEKHE